MRKAPLVEEHFYHIYNRGVDKRKVFESKKDYSRFLYNLYLSNSTQAFNLSDLIKYQESKELIFSLPREDELVSIHAYSLMPNHFHLIISQKKEKGISLFMQKLTTAYTMYFNKKSNRSGSLFQGTFKSKHIASDDYLRYLFAYVHANSFSTIEGEISEKNIEKVLNYEYSSILDYQDIIRPENSIVRTDFFEKEFTNKDGLIEQLKAWLSYHQHPEVKPQDIQNNGIVGV